MSNVPFSMCTGFGWCVRPGQAIDFPFASIFGMGPSKFGTEKWMVRECWKKQDAAHEPECSHVC